ncbi:MAG: ATP-binding protein, partial [Bacteroidales bacterium]|nr:ATP-binding protein [Bacteroidales bacterium]
DLLKAIAKEDNLSQPTSKAFIQKHALPTTSSVQTALAALLKKELVYQEKEYYYVYDVFFSRYLEGLR